MQIAKQVVSLNPLELRLPSRAWKVKLVGEGADDAGGVFDDTITEMCQVGWRAHRECLRAKEMEIKLPGMFYKIFSILLYAFCKLKKKNLLPGVAVWCGGSSDSYSQQLCRCGQ